MFEAFNVDDLFLIIKMDLAAPIIMFLDTNLILYNELTYICSVMGKNQHAKITILMASEVLNLSSSCSDHSHPQEIFIFVHAIIRYVYATLNKFFSNLK